MIGCFELGGRLGRSYAESVAVRYDNKFTLIQDVVFGGLILWGLLICWPAPSHPGVDPSVGIQKSNVRQIVLALHYYAKDSDGKYPATLEDLVDEGYLDDKTPLKTSYTKSGKSEPYIYLLGQTDTENPKAVLILAPPSPRPGYRVVGNVGGAVTQLKMTEEEVEKLLSEDMLVAP